MPKPEQSVDGREPEATSARACLNFRRFRKHVKAVIARLLLAVHGLYCIMRTHPSTHPIHWLMAVPIGLLPIEAWFTWKIHKGKEWKWVCPCVVLYLMSVIPAISFLELDRVVWDTAVKNMSNNKNAASAAIMAAASSHSSTNASSSGLGKLLKLQPLQEVRILEQLMLLFLIVSRWILPRQQISAEQKSSLLITYIGMSADILELFESFNEASDNGRTEFISVLLYLWACSNVQFIFVFTARRDGKSGTFLGLCFESELWANFLNLILQDAPFLVIRIYFMILFNSNNPGSVFFLVKNILVTLLILNRMYGIIHSTKEEEREERQKSGIRRTFSAAQINIPLLGDNEINDDSSPNSASKKKDKEEDEEEKEDKVVGKRANFIRLPSKQVIERLRNSQLGVAPKFETGSDTSLQPGDGEEAALIDLSTNVAVENENPLFKDIDPIDNDSENGEMNTAFEESTIQQSAADDIFALDNVLVDTPAPQKQFGSKDQFPKDKFGLETVVVDNLRSNEILSGEQLTSDNATAIEDHEDKISEVKSVADESDDKFGFHSLGLNASAEDATSSDETSIVEAKPGWDNSLRGEFGLDNLVQNTTVGLDKVVADKSPEIRSPGDKFGLDNLVRNTTTGLDQVVADKSPEDESPGDKFVLDNLVRNTTTGLDKVVADKSHESPEDESPEDESPEDKFGLNNLVRNTTTGLNKVGTNESPENKSTENKSTENKFGLNNLVRNTTTGLNKVVDDNSPEDKSSLDNSPSEDKFGLNNLVHNTTTGLVKPSKDGIINADENLVFQDNSSSIVSPKKASNILPNDISQETKAERSDSDDENNF